MYYEEERLSKLRRRRRRGPLGFLLGLLARLLIVIALVALTLYALPVSLFITDADDVFSPSAGLETDMINILLLGVDRLNDGAQRSDTIIIASVGYGSFKLTSVLRDTIVDIPGHGSDKINAAYAYGGPELTVRTLNMNFGLNITKYVVVDFVALAEAINALGGVDVAITYDEQAEINRNLADSWKKDFSKLGYDVSETSLLDLDFSDADEDGRITAHLDGFQALGYARIRRLDSDFTRAHRQRRIINAALLKFRQKWYDPLMLAELIRVVVAHVDTNMNPLELVSIGSKVLMCSEAGQLRLPADGTYVDTGSALSEVDYAENLEVFREFVYEE